MGVFAVMSVYEFFVLKSAIYTPGLLVSLIMLILFGLSTFVFTSGFNEENNNKMIQAWETLEGVNTPFDFLASLSLPATIFFFIGVAGNIIKDYVIFPDALYILIYGALYVGIALCPITFVMSFIKNKYGNGKDFLVYSVALIIYTLYNYFFNSNINPFACAQLFFAVNMWETFSSLKLDSAPQPKEKKTKKKKDKNKEEEETEKNTENKETKEMEESSEPATEE